MTFNWLKSIMAVSSLTILPTGMISSFSNYSNISAEDLFKQVKSSSQVISQNQVWNYDNKEFNSENELNNYLLQNNKIESITTSSNPSKIMSDYQNHILDNNQIYKCDYDKFVPVYRDAFGNATPNLESAVKTYSNEALTKIKYSYDNYNWFNSVEEAKDNYIDNTGIHKSLYYYINGKYYNVFNKQDQKLLKNSLKEGYIVDANQFDNKQEIFGTPDKLKNIVREDFKNKWTDPTTDTTSQDTLNYKKFMTFQTSHHLTITCDGSDLMGYWMDGTYIRQDTLSIDDPTNEIPASLFNGNGWKYDIEWAGAYSKDKWTKEWKTKKHNYLFEFKPRNAHINGSGFYWNQVNVSETFDAKVNLYANEVTDTSQPILQQFEAIPKNITSYSDIPTQYVNQAYEIWFNKFYDEKFLKIADNETKNEYGVHRDYLYDANGNQGYDYSLNKSQEYYENTLKKEILSGPTKTNENGEITYQLRTNFYVTKEQLDNYLFLGGSIDTRVMYTYLDVQDISSLDGLVLTNNEYEAKQKQLQLINHVMFYRYFAYDVFGNYWTSAESEKDALEQVYSSYELQEKLQARYINPEEIVNWHNHLKSFDNIVQDGIYQVYRIYSATKAQEDLDPYIYFDSFISALTAIKANINKETNITTKTVNVYFYFYIDKNNKTHDITYTNDEQLWNIVHQLVQ